MFVQGNQEELYTEVANVSASSQQRPQRQKPDAVQVPLSLLLAKDLTPAAKFLWIRMRFDELNPRPRSQRPKLLVMRTCLARSTVHEALRQASAAGWLVPRIHPESGKRRWKTSYPVRDPVRAKDRRVRIPSALIRAAHALRPQAILCYGLLQALPHFKPHSGAGMFKWAELRALTGLHLRTVKRAVQALIEARWVSTAQQNRRQPIRFRLQDADEACKQEMEKRLERADHVGEAFMCSLLSLIVESKDCIDRCRPDFLVNPTSGEKLELDRFYPRDQVAFEFNGKQHYEPSDQFTKEEVDAQKKRDAVKEQICRRKGITLVTVTANDLTLQGMLKKVGALLPIRALRGFKETIRFLSHRAESYRKVALEEEEEGLKAAAAG